MRSVVLSGFMATGKSTVGPRVAARLGLPFVDTDAEIERESARTVPEIWRAEGETAFRQREAVLVERLLTDEVPRVLAFGGGTVTVARTRRLALDRALIVTLTASAETIAGRVAELSNRPNLGVGGDPVGRANELLAERADAYGEAHLSLASDGEDVEALVDSVVTLVERDPIVVPLGTRSYTVDICDGEAARLTDALARLGPSSVVLVTDSNVTRARGATIHAALDALAVDVFTVVLPPGESRKTLASVSTIWDAALGAGVDRDALVVAVGGGVVGDLAGFAAACLLRGVRFVQVPTTLLAIVDASVGGKTGFDHPAGKNLVGAFHQPSAVVADLAHLETLPIRELRSGLGEVVKIALTSDGDLLARLERDAVALSRGDHGALVPVVRAAIEAKVRVVRDDERESGARALLNLGHTVGHALETHGAYARWLHGEAVAVGIVAELEAASRLGWTPPALAGRVAALLVALGLQGRVAPSDLAAAWSHVASDKKRVGRSVRLPVVIAPGESRVERVRLDALRGALFPT
jgi:shikimate kinase/3-dehydroquinate synthase